MKFCLLEGGDGVVTAVRNKGRTGAVSAAVVLVGMALAACGYSSSNAAGPVTSGSSSAVSVPAVSSGSGVAPTSGQPTGENTAGSGSPNTSVASTGDVSSDSSGLVTRGATSSAGVCLSIAQYADLIKEQDPSVSLKGGSFDYCDHEWAVVQFRDEVTTFLFDAIYQKQGTQWVEIDKNEACIAYAGVAKTSKIDAPTAVLAAGCGG